MHGTEFRMTDQTESDVLPPATRLGRTALRVTDLDELTEFYRDVVGLSVLRHGDTESVLGAGDTPLLVLEGDETALERHSSSAGLYHNAFRVPSREALGDALVRIRDNWQLDGASDHGITEALYLTDPEGNGIEIYRDFPREQWNYTADGSLRMWSDRLDLEALRAAAGGDEGVPAGTDVGHIHLEVSSLDAFKNFYADTVGFETQLEPPGGLFVSAGGYHHHIGANTFHHRSGPVAGRGLSWFEVVLPDTAALDALRDRFASSQLPVTETDDGIVVSDADEIEIRFRIET
jgi:catechol 2,3-dioxygenase